jgi:hypothetical protein
MYTGIWALMAAAVTEPAPLPDIVSFLLRSSARTPDAGH